MHKISTISWMPGCMVHRPGAYSYYHFVIVLHVDVITLKILTYTLRFSKELDGFSKPALIDLRHPNRFWLWQADRRNFKEQTASVIPQQGVVSLDFDSFGPFRVVRKLPADKLALLTNSLMKAFYDLSFWHLGYLYSPIRIPDALLLQRIDSAIEYANGFATARAN
ncbi:hypothetical protein [Pseudomonas sp. LB3P14]